MTNMKYRDFTETIHPYNYMTSSCCYEMELWVYDRNYEYTEEEIKRGLCSTHGIEVPAYRSSTGIYRTKDDALMFLKMISDDYYEKDDEDILLAYIRQKPINVQMGADAYLKEWTYVNEWLHDESIVRNYDVNNNRFFGRPKEMIRHKVGDIVIVVDGNNAHWGIVYALPPTPEEAKLKNDRALTKGHVYEDRSMLDYSDDSYIILISDGCYLASHQHIQAHHVIPSLNIEVPDIVRKVLEEGLKKAKDSNH